MFPIQDFFNKAHGQLFSASQDDQDDSPGVEEDNLLTEDQIQLFHNDMRFMVPIAGFFRSPIFEIFTLNFDMYPENVRLELFQFYRDCIATEVVFL
jgi:hypothetical protein